jgi:3'(2'), 5'-bisphosphate nucleotidase
MLQNNTQVEKKLLATLAECLPGVMQVAKAAGEKILEIYITDFTINNKTDNTPLTCADLAADELIKRLLKELTPHIPILSEESKPIPYLQRKNWQTYWLVDPLDGTKEFINHTDEFSVNIALVHKHQAIMGLIYNPVKKCAYYAIKGSGAFYSQENEAAQMIHVSKKRRQKIILAGTHAKFSAEMEGFVKNLSLTTHGYEMIKMGSSLKSCLIAQGVADIYARLGPTSEWDTAAAQCIVEEAGGLITNTRMQPLQYNTKESLLNPHFFVFGDKSVDWSSYLLKK